MRGPIKLNRVGTRQFNSLAPPVAWKEDLDHDAFDVVRLKFGMQTVEGQCTQNVLGPYRELRHLALV